MAWVRVCWVCVTVTACTLCIPGAAQPTVTDAEVAAGIERMKAWLYGLQDPATGSFDSPSWSELRNQGYHATGETALITYALMLAGESHQDPRIAKAIQYLRDNPTDSTYLASMRCHIWARMPGDGGRGDAFAELREAEAEYLRSAERGGKFYYQADHPTWSNSLTQYGMLGLWEHAKRGGEVDDRLWVMVGEHTFDDQNPDGGWGYNDGPGRGGGDSTGSMTAAGVAVLQIAQQRLAREEDLPDPRLDAAIARGLAWLDARFDPAVNPGLEKRYRFYYLYGIERLALAGGVSRLNGRDWFAAGARFILDEEDGDGTVRGNSNAEMSGRISTAFALSFLARGRVPVWAAKLELDVEPPEAERRRGRRDRDEDAEEEQEVPRSAGWNARPNDLYFLTRHLSDQREAELNWQIAARDAPAEDWLRAPVLWASGRSPVEFDGPTKAKLKRYLDLGGTLIVNQEGRGTRFQQSFQRLARELYPDYRPAPLGREHPFANLVIPAPAAAQSRSIGNGVRDLMVFPRGDWGMVFQAQDAGRGSSWDVMTNVFAALTDRGRPSNRLEPVLPVRNAEREPSGLSVTVGRAVYAGNWDAEPAAWEVATVDAFNRSGVAVTAEPIPLASIAEGDIRPLIHLAGTDAAWEPTEDELAAVRDYVAAGGTLLVESVGGLSSFADAAAASFAEALGGTRRPLEPLHPVYTGEGLPGSVAAGRVRYRGHAQARGAVGNRAGLEAVVVDGRAAVIVSSRDLSLGAIGARHERINGYAPDSARALLHNLAVWAAADRSGDAGG